MTIASVTQFLEEYDGVSLRDNEKEFPGFLSLGKADIPVEPKKSVQIGNASVEDEIEAARLAGYEEGCKAEREMLQAEHERAISALKLELQVEHGDQLKAMEQSFASAVEKLFQQYDSWMDRLLETQLEPLLRRALKVEALQQMRAALTKAAGRGELEVTLSGPDDLVSAMERMLVAQDMKVRREPGGSEELVARIADEQMQTRLARMETHLSEPAEAEPNDAA